MATKTGIERLIETGTDLMLTWESTADPHVIRKLLLCLAMETERQGVYDVLDDLIYYLVERPLSQREVDVVLAQSR